MKKIVCVTNFCTHYTIGTFERLAKVYDATFYFFSRGGEKYWQRQHGTRTGAFKYRYLSGFSLFNTRITPELIWRLFNENFDVYICGIDGKFALPVTFMIAKIKKKPFVLWTGVWVRLQTRIQKLFFPVVHYIFQHSDAIVTYGTHVKEYLVGEGVAEAKIFPTHHAVDNAMYSVKIPVETRKSLLERLKISPDKKIILYLGRLTKIKGLPYLLEAFSRANLAGSVLLFAGTGEEEESLRQQAKESGVADQVIFSGYVPIEEAIQYYSIAWCLVLPSIHVPEGKETWGLVVNEAMNQGVPVIASTAVGAAAGGLVQHEKNGIIVVEKDAGELENALTRIVVEKGFREKLSAGAKATISAWTQDCMVEDFAKGIEYAFNVHN